jgi:hypothetical protein
MHSIALRSHLGAQFTVLRVRTSQTCCSGYTGPFEEKTCAAAAKWVYIFYRRTAEVYGSWGHVWEKSPARGIS